MTLRILVADDNETLRIGVRALVKERDGWDLCGEAANGEEAIDRVRQLAPDVIVLDLTMPVMNGFQAAAEIRRIAPSVKIVFYSVHEVPSTALEVGADAFVSKSSAARELLTVIERIASQSQPSHQNTDSTNSDSQEHFQAQPKAQDQRHAPPQTHSGSAADTPYGVNIEVTDIESETKVRGCTTDLGMFGCSFNTLTSIPKGTRVLVNLAHEGTKVVAVGKVVYSRVELGTGIVFITVDPKDQRILTAWIADLAGHQTSRKS